MIEIKDNDFKKLTEYIKLNYGINLQKKKNLIEGRLSNLLVEKNYKNFSTYIESILNDKTGQEITSLLNKITTNHTFFMREATHFQFFKDKVLPEIVPKIKDKDLRVWSAGCSTGQEPSTLAMILSDYFGEEKRFWDTSILATDISVKALEEAEEGIYPKESIEELPPGWKQKYFIRTDTDKYKICDSIRNEIIYRIFNLMEGTFPFKRRFHVIFCRNVMIYFDQKTKMELVKRFYEFTEPGGYLFIGHSESLIKGETEYRYVMPAVYRKG